MKNRVQTYLAVLAMIVVSISCQKKDRPALGDYPKDSNPPGGPLKFYAAFDGTTDNPLFNAVDSIRANFAADNPLTSIAGISGKGLQGKLDKAVKYAGANDFAKSTSFTVALWLKNTPWAGGPGFVFSLSQKDMWNNSIMFLMFEDQGQSTTTEATMKFNVMDQWFEFTGANRFKKPILDGQWHHLAIAYDEATSKLTYYFDGAAVSGVLPNQMEVTKDNKPRGALKLTDNSGGSGSFVFGGWNKQVGLSGPTDSWIQGFNGGLDQLRLYSKALNASEIQALYNSKL